MAGKKKTGVDLDLAVVEQLDALVDECRGLQLSRSEAINAILDAFLNAEFKDRSKLQQLRHLVIKKRKR